MKTMDDYKKYYIQGSDHYLIPKDEFEPLVDKLYSVKIHEADDTSYEYIKIKDKYYVDVAAFQYLLNDYNNLVHYTLMLMKNGAALVNEGVYSSVFPEGVDPNLVVNYYKNCIVGKEFVENILDQFMWKIDDHEVIRDKDNNIVDL